MSRESVENINETQQGGCEARDKKNVKSEDPALADDRDDKRRQITNSKNYDGGDSGGIVRVCC